MKNRVVTIWEDVRSSYWFVPTVMAVAAGLLSILTTRLDRTAQEAWIGQLGFVWSGGPDGARGLLSTIAGSMVTVTGLTFSITIVAFSQASSQYGPRLLNNLMYDTGNQVVIGTFTATFIYSLLVLRTIRTEDAGLFVPRLSVTIGVFLSLASLGVLIFFIHHAAVSLQAHHVVTGVAEDLLGTIDRMYPHDGEYESEERRQERLALEGLDTPDRAPAGRPVPATTIGYIETVDIGSLTDIARKEDLLVVVHHGPGRFVAAGRRLASVSPLERADDAIVSRVRGAFVVGKRRTHIQDVEFGVSQLAEIAVRSMSPSINDPVTAAMCVDWLGAALSVLANRTLAAPLRFDERNALRVVAVEAPSFAGLVRLGISQIRRHAQQSVQLRLHMLDTIGAIATNVQRADHLQVLRSEAILIERSAQALPEEDDRQEVRARLEELFESTLRDSGQPGEVG